MDNMGLDILDGWTKNWRLMEAFFDEADQASIEGKLKGLAVRHIIYCSFESRFARSGGLAAATARILPHLRQLPGIERVALLTPFYPYIIDENRLEPVGISIDVPFDGEPVTVEILKYVPEPGKEEDTGVEEYYLKAAGFFDAHNRLKDPYIYFKDRPRCNDDAIKKNALFFSKAAPMVAGELGLKEDVIFHLQEWQTALVSLTAKIAMIEGHLVSAGTVQTVHNPFDSFISLEDIEKIIDKGPLHRYIHWGAEGHTAYQLGLQLVDAPVTTVSENFAVEFTSDLLQSRHFAPHLQDIFQHNGVYGIANGSFTEVLEDYAGLTLEAIDVDEIKAVKLKKRKALLKILSDYHPAGRFGTLTYKGKAIDRLPQRVPILVMSGRLDPSQKGFDIFLRAIEKFEKDEIKVVLTPMPIRDSDLGYFYKVAYRRRGDLTVFPIRMEEGYHELQTGSTFGVMPSIYEPFGAAVEYMALGTVTIARKTGGLDDQVEDGVSGFLFEENHESYRWEHIDAFNKSAAAVEQRQGNPWLESMVEQLALTIKKAASLYKNQPDDYYRMIASGLQKARSFKWPASAGRYMEVFNYTGKGFKNSV
jgi:glycogen synthase